MKINFESQVQRHLRQWTDCESQWTGTGDFSVCFLYSLWIFAAPLSNMVPYLTVLKPVSCNQQYSFFVKSSLCNLHWSQEKKVCALLRAQKTSHHQSCESLLHLQVRGHTASQAPPHSLKAEHSFGRVIPGRAKDAFTIRCCCSCAVSWGSIATLSANQALGRWNSTDKQNCRLLLSWTKCLG